MTPRVSDYGSIDSRSGPDARLTPQKPAPPNSRLIIAGFSMQPQSVSHFSSVRSTTSVPRNPRVPHTGRSLARKWNGT